MGHSERSEESPHRTLGRWRRVSLAKIVGRCDVLSIESFLTTLWDIWTLVFVVGVAAWVFLKLFGKML